MRLGILTTICLALTTMSLNAASLVYGDKGVSFVWGSGDRVGFLTATGTQVGYGMQSIAADGHCASTTGYGWSLKTGTMYYAYAPYNVSYSVNENTAGHLPVSYTNQQQSGNDNTDHLAAKAFLCGSVYASIGAVNVPMYPMTSVVRIEEKFSSAVTVTKVELGMSAAKIPVAGYMNIKEERFVATEYATSLTLTTDNLTVGTDGVATVYITLPPCDLSGSIVNVTFYTADGGVYRKSLDGFEIMDGMTYCIGGAAQASTVVNYTPPSSGTLKNPMVIAYDLPVYRSFVSTGIAATGTERSAEGYDLLGRRSATQHGGVIITNGKKIKK